MNVLKRLFNPIFLLAVGLHAGLLFIPVAGGSSDDSVPAPDPAGESISVTRIPPQVATPAPVVSRPAAPTRVAAARPVTAARIQQRRTVPSNARTQAGQQSPSSGNTSSSRADNTRPASTNNNQGNQTALNNPSSPGLPSLPNDETITVPVTVPSEGPTTQKAPTLTALRNGASSQRVPQVLKDFLTRFQYSLKETRDIATAEAQRAWLDGLEGRIDIQASPPQSLEKAFEITYPLQLDDNGPRLINVCLSPLPKTGLVGVVINADGEIATKPALLRSSGYPFLNDVALATIQNYDAFPEADGQKIYTVPVDVNYDEDACVSLAKLGVAESDAATTGR